MKFYSTNDRTNRASFRNAVIKGLADDGGLYMPEQIPVFDSTFLSELKKYSFAEIGYEIASKFIEEDEITSF